MESHSSSFTFPDTPIEQEDDLLCSLELEAESGRRPHCLQLSVVQRWGTTKSRWRIFPAAETVYGELGVAPSQQ